MELKVWVEGIQRIVCGVTNATTCQVIIVIFMLNTCSLMLHFYSAKLYLLLTLFLEDHQYRYDTT